MNMIANAPFLYAMLRSGKGIEKASGLSAWSVAPNRSIAPFARKPLCPPRAVSLTDQSLLQKASVLSNWLRSRGVDLSTTAVEVSSAAGGLVAARPVAQGEVLLAIPESVWLTPAVALETPGLGPVLEGLENWLVLALFLLHERSRGDASPWAGYIAAISPKTPSSSPVLWEEHCAARQHVKGSQLGASIDSYLSYFRSTYESLQHGLFKEHPDVFFPSNDDTLKPLRKNLSQEENTPLSFHDFLWAVCTVRARVLAPLEGESLALTPLADLVQHRRANTCSWRVSSASKKGFFEFGGIPKQQQQQQQRVLEMVAERALAPGDVVSLDFGGDKKKTDSQVLLDHGVIDPEARTSSYALTICLPAEDPLYDDKADVLELNGEPLSGEHLLSGDAVPPVSDNLLATLRLLNLSGADAFLLESIFRNETWGHMQLPVSEENESKVYRLLIDGCASALQGYSTTIDKDLALLSSGAVEKDDQLHAAVWATLGEKEALDATLRFFEERIGRLAGGMEFYAERRLKRLGLLDESGKTTWDGFFDQGIA